MNRKAVASEDNLTFPNARKATVSYEFVRLKSASHPFQKDTRTFEVNKYIIANVLIEFA